MNKQKLRRILSTLSPDGTSADFKAFDDSVLQLKSGLKEKIQVKTLEDVNNQLERFRKRFDLTAITSAFQKLDDSLNARVKETQALLEDEFAAYKKLTADQSGTTNEKISEVYDRISGLKRLIDSLEAQKGGDLKELRSRVELLAAFEKRAAMTFIELENSIAVLNDQEYPSFKDIEIVTTELEKLRRELTNRINNIPRGGGNANRNIAIGGNTSVLSLFTDINIKAGNNVSLTYQNNQTTKYLDLTITATGGGGSSVAGITRSINRISTSQAAGNTTGTDYTYVCAAGVNLTLPDAAGNTNLYTVKNIAASSVLVTTTAGQTIDSDATLILATQFTSVDLQNDGSDNWSIT